MQTAGNVPLLLATDNQQQPTRQISSNQQPTGGFNDEPTRKKMTRTREKIRASRLIKNLSQFLASRNQVISRYSRFDKIVTSSSNNNRVKARGGTSSCVLNFERSTNLRRSYCDSNCLHSRICLLEQSARSNRSEGCVCCSCCLADGTSRSKLKRSPSRVRLLISALMSRKQRNRTSVLVTLLRAPIVLAAMFSLALVASLLVLYTMSFIHHHRHFHPEQTAAEQQTAAAGGHQSASAAKAEAEVAAQAARTANQRRISSRHLQIASGHADRAAGSSGVQLDNDMEEEEEKEANLRRLVVQTECGSFVGKLELEPANSSSSILFKGIPYASAPIGSRRWANPRPIWLDKAKCQVNGTHYKLDNRPAGGGDHCAQLSPVTRRFTGHEDCLYLDIYLPKLEPAEKRKRKQQLLPVMVYIHGGFLASGSSGEGPVNWMRTGPSGRLASELNVVLVAFNYRLQALGFMSLPEASGSSDGKADGIPAGANFGLWDQLVALNWIRRNIESFSGDPNNIVLFGPDSASALPLALLNRRGLEPPQPEAQTRASTMRQQPAQQTSAAHDYGRQSGRVKATSDLLTSGRDLFRAVWLTNPAVYYELPIELAAQHYRRLFLGAHSPCAKFAQASSLDEKLSTSGRVNLNLTATDSGGSGRLTGGGIRECLMGLSAEQVARLYLAQDDPTYRLDDQNSLPIHGIYASQFVTLDHELVQAGGYPFDASTAGDEPQPLNLGPPIGGEEVTGSRVDLLLGSTAQAVEYWPCPKDLGQWTWEDFRRYVAISLNSFLAGTYEEASKLYKVPGYSIISRQQTSRPRHIEQIDVNMTQNGSSPQEIYLTMVSDIRQTCPANRLADHLRRRGQKVRRYMVDYRPKGKFRAPPGKLQPDEVGPQSSQPKFAFHNWDLIAFFNFQSDFEPSQEDLKFQTQIRQMVSDFVHTPVSIPRDRLFTRDGSIEDLSSPRKQKECRMWSENLGLSYAWVS